MTAVSPPDELQHQPQELDADSDQEGSLGTEITKPQRQGEPDEWRSRPSREGRIGLAALAAFLAVAIVARIHTAGRPLDAETFVAAIVGLSALVLAALVGLLTYGRYSLRYRLDGRGLAIDWLWMRETIPLAGIEAIFRGTRLGEKTRVKGIVWQGYQVGTAEAEEVGPLKFFGTSRDPSAAIIVAAAGHAYALTPSNLEGFRDRLIELLEAIPEGEPVGPPETGTSRRYLPFVSPLELRKALFWTAGIAVGAAILWAVLQIPTDVPDTHTKTGASAIAEVNDWASAGHTFRMDRDGLSRIDVALSTLRRTDAADLQFYVREEVQGTNLRSLRVKLDRLPEGKALDLYKIPWQDLPWFSFEFEPLSGYAGKTLYFNIEGKDIPRANTVQLLLGHPNSYDRGEGYTSEKPADGNLIFHTYARGTLSDLLGVTLPLLSRGKSGLLGRTWIYWGLAVAALVTIVALLVSLLRLGRNPAPMSSVSTSTIVDHAAHQ